MWLLIHAGIQLNHVTERGHSNLKSAPEDPHKSWQCLDDWLFYLKPFPNLMNTVLVRDNELQAQ